MDQEDIFSSLPPEIIVNILSRIPFKTVFACKCVCKSWLDLLETPEFARSHLSKSVPGLLLHRATLTNVFRIVKFEDSLEIERREGELQTVLDLEIYENFDLRYGSVTIIEGSANGLLFMRNAAPHLSDHYVCNPITREYIKLPKPEGILQNGTIVNYGFGMSRLSNTYKVVRNFHNRVCDPVTGSLLSIPKSVWQVYTLGSESWRGIPTPSEMLLDYGYGSNVSLFNGNLHWLARDLRGFWWISCFDLETEAFTKFRAPIVESGGSLNVIGVFRDRLCLYDNSSESEMIIYVMDDYGDEKKSWNKEYAISKPYNVMMCAVKAFGNGDILLMARKGVFLFCYSDRTKTLSRVDMFDYGEGLTSFLVEVISYTPSFISLKDFETENAKLFEFVCYVI